MAKNHGNLTQEHVKRLFIYNPDTGDLIWNIKPSGVVNKGDRAGNPNSQGYVRVIIKRKEYFVHNIAWLYVYGYWPINELDHRDRNPSNNRIDNLREATRTQNVRNRRFTRGKKYRGVHWNASNKKWEARITVNKRTISLGCFLGARAAAIRYDYAAKEYFGEFAVLNFEGH